MIEKLNEIKKMDLECGVFSVYDMDGKTTQEIFNQFFTKINDVIDATNASVNLIEYLVEIGLKEEIAEKLSEWLGDGTLEDVIDSKVLVEMSEKIDETLKKVEEQKDEVEGMMYKIEENFGLIQEREGYNVKYYGANGDGVEDDTDAFKKALFAAQHDETNKTVYVPSGVYLIHESLNIPEGVTVIGDASSIIKLNRNHICINLDGSDIMLKDITIDGNRASVTTTNAINIETSYYNVTIKDVVFKSFTGVELNLINVKALNGLNIESCVFKDIIGSQVKLINIGKGSKAITIKDNKFEGCIGRSGDNYAISIEGSTAFSYSDAIISGNMFNTEMDACIRIKTGNISIINNIFNIPQTGIVDKHAVFIEDGFDIKIKNNIYNLIGSYPILNPIIKVNAGKQITIEADTVFIDMPAVDSGLSTRRQLFVLKDSDVSINNVSMTGSYHSDSIIDATNMTSLKIRNCTVDMDNGTTPVFLTVQGRTTFEIIGNNINLYNAKMLVKAENVTSAGKVIIKDNQFSALLSRDIVEKDCVRIENFESAIIENNRLNGDVTVKDFKTLELIGNILGRLYVESNVYDIVSQNNTFTGRDRACYELSCNSEEKCRLLSRNNYNKSNYRLILFYCSNGNFLNASNMDIKTIDDINSDEVQMQKNEYIVRETNVTADIFKQCYVKTTQEHPRFTWYSTEQPLIDYIKPNGTIIYNASTGKSAIYITHNGITKVTQL